MVHNWQHTESRSRPPTRQSSKVISRLDSAPRLDGTGSKTPNIAPRSTNTCSSARTNMSQKTNVVRRRHSVSTVCSPNTSHGSTFPEAPTATSTPIRPVKAVRQSPTRNGCSAITPPEAKDISPTNDLGSSRRLDRSRSLTMCTRLRKIHEHNIPKLVDRSKSEERATGSSVSKRINRCSSIPKKSSFIPRKVDARPRSNERFNTPSSVLIEQNGCASTSTPTGRHKPITQDRFSTAIKNDIEQVRLKLKNISGGATSNVTSGFPEHLESCDWAEASNKRSANGETKRESKPVRRSNSQKIPSELKKEMENAKKSKNCCFNVVKGNLNTGTKNYHYCSPSLSAGVSVRNASPATCSRPSSVERPKQSKATVSSKYTGIPWISKITKDRCASRDKNSTPVGIISDQNRKKLAKGPESNSAQKHCQSNAMNNYSRSRITSSENSGVIQRSKSADRSLSDTSLEMPQKCNIAAMKTRARSVNLPTRSRLRDSTLSSTSTPGPDSSAATGEGPNLLRSKSNTRPRSLFTTKSVRVVTEHKSGNIRSLIPLSVTRKTTPQLKLKRDESNINILQENLTPPTTGKENVFNVNYGPSSSTNEVKGNEPMAIDGNTQEENLQSNKQMTQPLDKPESQSQAMDSQSTECEEMDLPIDYDDNFWLIKLLENILREVEKDEEQRLSERVMNAILCRHVGDRIVDQAYNEGELYSILNRVQTVRGNLNDLQSQVNTDPSRVNEEVILIDSVVNLYADRPLMASLFPRGTPSLRHLLRQFLGDRVLQKALKLADFDIERAARNVLLRLNKLQFLLTYENLRAELVRKEIYSIISTRRHFQ